MLKRLMPLILTLAAMLIDTAILPVFYHGTFVVPLLFPLIMCISLINGRMQGLLFGMIGGLLVDITTGTLGIMTFFFMIVGFLMGLIIVPSVDVSGPIWRQWLRRTLAAFLLFLTAEILFVIYRFFVTNSFAWLYLRDGLIRSGIAALLTDALYIPLRKLFTGSKEAHTVSSEQEVKLF
ncbi:MAG: hypothetical protein IJ234_08755 [Clostridia bacterium]|nr:hypothetical protein [Clostridia bacterium]